MNQKRLCFLWFGQAGKRDRDDGDLKKYSINQIEGSFVDQHKAINPIRSKMSNRVLLPMVGTRIPLKGEESDSISGLITNL